MKFFAWLDTAEEEEEAEAQVSEKEVDGFPSVSAVIPHGQRRSTVSEGLLCSFSPACMFDHYEPLVPGVIYLLFLFVSYLCFFYYLLITVAS